MKRLKHRGWGALAGLGLTAMIAGGVGLNNVGASSHREAPLISEDPVADTTDVYAFVSPDRPDSLTVLANWIPLEEPAGGPNFHRFGDDVLYELNLDLDGDAIDDLDYQFRFKTQISNPNTFLYNTGPITSLDDPDWNMRQTYTVTQILGSVTRVLGEDLVVPPANIGPRSTPNYEKNLGSAGVYSVATPGGFGETKVFAGPRNDPFFVDLGSVFDLAGLRPLNAAHVIPLDKANGVDNVAGYNTHTIAVQIPLSMIKAYQKDHGGDPIVGVYSRTYRRETRVLNWDGAKPGYSGSWVPVSRLGMPLVNEVVVPLGAKDRFNTSEPVNDAQFGAKVLDPEVAGLIPVLYPGVTVPPAPRNDIAAIFLTGIPGLNQPKNVKASEMIRINPDIKPTVSDPNKQNRLGLLGGDNDGFPNGRRLVDDVVDIELQALAGATPFTPAFNKAPNNLLGDGVDRDDTPYLSRFPYAAAPIQGYESR